jgi:hypothetical protein
MLNMVAVVAVIGYAASHGWLEHKRVTAALEALKGEEAHPQVATTQVAHAEKKPEEPGDSKGSASDRIRRNEDVEEIQRTEFERRTRELSDGWKLLEAQQLAFLRSKEEFEADRRRIAEETAERAKHTGDGGLNKELEIVSGVKPKDAKELLKLKNQADAVQMLVKMDARVARKIVSQCKTQEERLWIGRILEKIKDVDASQAEFLAAGK